MPKIKLLLTNDYEIAGNGQGSVKNDLIDRTATLLDLCNTSCKPMTLFVDIVELWAFQKAEEDGELGPNYKDFTDIVEQLQQAYCAGHDIQLHLHPQWIGASPNSATSWNINTKYWRTPNVPGGYGSKGDRSSILGLIYQGKIELERIVKAVDPNYECTSFRAGGYCIQPEQDVLRALHECNFTFESSVCPGRQTNNKLSFHDYSITPFKPYWKIYDRVTSVTSQQSNLYEIPVFTLPKKRLDTHRFFNKPNIANTRSLFSSILSSKSMNFDFCKLDFLDMRYFLSEAEKMYKNQVEEIPIVLIGHSKENFEIDQIKQLFDYVDSQKNIEFTKFNDILSVKRR